MPKTFTHEISDEFPVYDPFPIVRHSLWRRIKMWRHWSDVWAGFGLFAATIAFILLVWCILWFTVMRVEFTGYRIMEEITQDRRMKYYMVVRGQRHSSDEVIFSSPNVDEALRVKRELEETIREGR